MVSNTICISSYVYVHHMHFDKLRSLRFFLFYSLLVAIIAAI